MEPTKVSLINKTFDKHLRTVAGLLHAVSGEHLTDRDILIIKLIKESMFKHNETYITTRTRQELAHKLGLKKQTLYNRLYDLKRKKALRDHNGHIKLSALLNDEVNIQIRYSITHDEKFQNTTPVGEDLWR